MALRVGEGRISRCRSRRCGADRFVQFFSHSQRVWVSSGRVLTSSRRTASMALLSWAGQVVAVEGHSRVRQVRSDAGDERGAHVGAGVGDLLRVAPVLG